jgi:uncharacterized membrane protein YgaE (UPF0421/DUF939 family)
MKKINVIKKTKKNDNNKNSWETKEIMKKLDKKIIYINYHIDMRRRKHKEIKRMQGKREEEKNKNGLERNEYKRK